MTRLAGAGFLPVAGEDGAGPGDPGGVATAAEGSPEDWRAARGGGPPIPPPIPLAIAAATALFALTLCDPSAFDGVEAEVSFAGVEAAVSFAGVESLVEEADDSPFVGVAAEGWTRGATGGPGLVMGRG